VNSLPKTVTVVCGVLTCRKTNFTHSNTKQASPNTQATASVRTTTAVQAGGSNSVVVTNETLLKR